MTTFRLWLTMLLGASLLLVSGLPSAAVAALPDSVKQDFTPLEGYVIMPVDGEYLVDIDASQGLRTGDLLSVSQPGEKIVHPISGEVIGVLNKKLAVLSVTQIKTGYSYAQVISGDTNLSKGTPVKRFSGLSAQFNGQGPATAALYQELSTSLPALDWQGRSNPGSNGETTAADLLFSLAGTKLEVKNAAGQLIRSYQLEISAAAISTPLPPQVPLATAIPATTDSSWPKKQTAATGVSYETDHTGIKTLGTINSDTLMSDFIATTAGLLMATTDGTTVRIYRVTDQLQLASEYKYPGRAVHALSWWQPTPDVLYLAVSGSTESPPTTGTTTETNPSSSILQFSSEQLTPVNDNLAYFLGSFDRNGDGRRETLLGQDLDLDIFYGRVVQLHLQNGEIHSEAPGFDLPSPFPVQGSLFVDLTGDKKLETVTVTRGLLTIYNGKKMLYQSRKELGGSISQLTYDINPGQADALFTSATFEVAPIATDIDGDGQPELIAISSDHPTFVTAWNQNKASEVRLSVFKFQAGDFIKGAFGATFSHPVQGLYSQKTRLLLVTSGLMSKNVDDTISQLVTIPLRN